MRVVELSMEELRREALRLARLVQRDYQPDCVLYVARAGFPVARAMGLAFGAPLVRVRALRRDCRLKRLSTPVLRRLPLPAKCFLRRMELGAHKIYRRATPQVLVEKGAAFAGCRRLLVVDDSVDTGATLAAVCRQVRQHFGKCSVRTAALNVWDGSARRVKSDYFLYRNTLLLTPMSRDSAHYPAFVAAYGAEA